MRPASEYTIPEIEEALATIDRETYPDRAKQLERALAAKRVEAAELQQGMEVKPAAEMSIAELVETRARTNPWRSADRANEIDAELLAKRRKITGLRKEIAALSGDDTPPGAMRLTDLVLASLCSVGGGVLLFCVIAHDFTVTWNGREVGVIGSLLSVVVLAAAISVITGTTVWSGDRMVRGLRRWLSERGAR